MMKHELNQEVVWNAHQVADTYFNKIFKAGDITELDERASNALAWAAWMHCVGILDNEEYQEEVSYIKCAYNGIYDILTNE